MDCVLEKDILNIENAVSVCYSECPRTTELHHDFSGFTVKQCAKDVINKLNTLNNYNFYLVFNKGDLVGYFGTTVSDGYDCLYTFFVRPKYRNQNNLPPFWSVILSKFDGDFFAGIYSSNEPATRFLTRNGGKIIKNDNISYFVFNRS